MIQRILITGGLGFIGSHLAKSLAEDHEVIVFDHSNWRTKNLALETLPLTKVIHGDTRNKEALLEASKAVDSIVHLAALQGTNNFYRIPHEVLDVNVKGLINAVEACVANRIKRFFFASSAEVYGIPRVFPTPETHELIIPNILNSRYSFAASKIIGEAFVVNYAKKFGFDYTIARYDNIYGPNMRRDQVVIEFINRLAKLQKFTVQGDGNQTRSFCYITDAVDCTMRGLLSAQGANEVFNVGNSSEEHTINQLIETLERVSGQRISPTYVPLEGAGATRRQLDITKAARELGYRPRVTLEEGLRRTLEWYKAEAKRLAQP